MSDDLPGRITGLQRSNGGVPKLPVESAAVSQSGMEGDRQRNRRFHGGPDRALCLYSQELIDALEAEGHPIVRGAVGENVTIAGLPWGRVRPGATLTIGEVEVEVTSYTAPCENIEGAFMDGRFVRISQRVHPGWSRVYVRIRRGGTLRVGDEVRLAAPDGG
jgi:MOSC domain-containing protein YiiM